MQTSRVTMCNITQATSPPNEPEIDPKRPTGGKLLLWMKP